MPERELEMMHPYQHLPPMRLVEGRMPYVLERCRARSVLHIGCVDTGYMEDRFARGELLHQRLSQTVSNLWGSDINEEGLDFLRRQGFEQLISADASFIGDHVALTEQHFEVIVATELMEHLSNPGLFLNSVRRLMTEDTLLIVSVPNAFRLRSILHTLRRVEFVHPDHNYWYSHYTITNLLRKHGFNVTETQMYLAGSIAALRRQRIQELRTSPLALLKYFLGVPVRFLLRRTYGWFPYMADGILVCARAKRDAE